MIRIPNLVFICLLQFILFYQFIFPIIPMDELAISHSQSLLVLISLLCIVASGNVINNIYDAAIDSQSERKSIIPKYFSPQFAWRLYWIFVLTGLSISIYLSNVTGFYYSLTLYPISVLCLWYYSYKLKCLPLIGNILISFFTGAVVLLIPYIFWSNLENLRLVDFAIWADIMYKFIMLFVLAVLSNLAREIIKDLEDMEVDKIQHCLSTGNYFGQSKCRFILLNIWLALLIIIGSVFWTLPDLTTTVSFLLLICIPAIFILIKLILLPQIQDFRKLSIYLKSYMIAGLIYWTLIA